MLVRRARTADVTAVRRLIDTYAPDRRLLSKPTVVLYEDVQEFRVVEFAGRVVGCGALHVMWEDLAEVRTLAVDPTVQGRGIGAALLGSLLEGAKELGVRRVFCLTFETEFFGRHGFVPIGEESIDDELAEELRQSPDEGVGEFLDLAHLKPNTLGNTRMLLQLS